MNIEDFAPVVLFVYNRPEHTKKTLYALAENENAKYSELFIFADGPKKEASKEQIKRISETREICKAIKGFKSVTIFEADENKGLAQNIITGVTDIIEKYGRIIVLEDDIVTGKYFLNFMNEGLRRYKEQKRIWHITGWRDPIKNTELTNSYLYPTMDCWSWATWKDRWMYFEKNPKKLKSIFTPEMKKKFNIEGADPLMFLQIEKNITGEINTWAIFWYATIFMNNGLCLAPTQSLVRNIGFDNTGENCGKNNGQMIYESINHQIIEFPQKYEINVDEFQKNIDFIKYLRKQNFSIVNYIYNKLPSYIRKKLKLLLKKKYKG